ncbi:hypothetical protein C0J50_23903 [Silurus asotus]|uniref:Uncharacterized protein n=1 Tax=Silurus asotus TaxID=30991 RepID=A0AAD5AIP4_SILAS|nr:hypothetical protein C0J50_23903 [Silurus asotus]
MYYVLVGGAASLVDVGKTCDRGIMTCIKTGIYRGDFDFSKAIWCDVYGSQKAKPALVAPSVKQHSGGADVLVGCRYEKLYVCTDRHHLIRQSSEDISL